MSFVREVLAMATVAHLHVAPLCLLVHACSYGVKSMLEEARREQSAFEALFTTIGRGERVKHNVDLFDMGGIASAILDAEIKYRANQFHVSCGHLMCVVLCLPLKLLTPCAGSRWSV